MKIKAIHHVAILTDDYEKIKKFYTEVLGFAVLAETLGSGGVLSRRRRISSRRISSLCIGNVWCGQTAVLRLVNGNIGPRWNR